jgi:hypothetical protein
MIPQRVAKVRKKIEQKRLLLAQAEIRQTRTRRRTQKPDYVYNNDVDSEASTRVPEALTFPADRLFLDF